MTIRHAAVLASIVLLLAGCGGDDTEGTRTMPSASAPAPSEVPTLPSDLQSPRPQAPRTVTTQMLLDTATSSAETILTRDHRRFDEQVERAKALTTGGFTGIFSATSDAVRRQVLADKIDVTAEVVGAGVTAFTPEGGEVLVFVDQTTTSAGEESLDQLAVLVELVGDDQQLLVAGARLDGEAIVGDATPEQTEILEAARAFSTALVNISYTTLEDDAQKLRALTTGSLAANFEKTLGPLGRTITSSRSTLSGTVTAIGASEASAERVTLVVATTGTVQTLGGDGPTDRVFRLRLGLRPVGGGWAVDSLELL